MARANPSAATKDSARKLLVGARATPREDPSRNLGGYEAVVRVILGDHDEAVDLIRDYLAVHPEHRKGFAVRAHPWWLDLRGNRRFQALIAGAR
jgi:hypothetical protein